MVFFNYSTMQMAAKVVYYGPGLCGKTTNLQWVFDHTSKDSRGEMVSLATETDRTLFFDLLPIDVGTIAGFNTRIQLYTVPGQVFYNTTRKLVLKGVDGVVFVADSQTRMLQANIDSLNNLEENLVEMGLTLDTIPVVLQYNKRDLPDILPPEELDKALKRKDDWISVEASALTGEGVFETLKMVSKETLKALKKRLTKGRSEGGGPQRAMAAPGARPPLPKPPLAKAPLRPPPAPGPRPAQAPKPPGDGPKAPLPRRPTPPSPDRPTGPIPKPPTGPMPRPPVSSDTEETKPPSTAPEPAAEVTEVEPIEVEPIEAEPIEAEPIEAEPIEAELGEQTSPTLDKAPTPESAEIEPPPELPEIEPVVEEPQPVAPEPVAPEPVAPEPVALEPVAPEPVALEPVALEPAALEPAADEPESEPEPTPVEEPPSEEPTEVEVAPPEPVMEEPAAPEPVIEEPRPAAPARRRKSRLGGMDALAELEKLRRQALHPKSGKSGQALTRGTRRHVEVAFPRIDLRSGQRVRVSLRIEDEDQQVLGESRQAEIELQEGESLEKLRLVVALKAEES